MERVYSAVTPVYKFYFTTIWPGLWGFRTAVQFLSDEPEIREGRWESLVAGVVGSILIWWLYAGLKGVSLDGPVLVITNFRREIRVDAGQIARVTEKHLPNPLRIRITFRQPTEFGRSIHFIPRDLGWFRFRPSEVTPRLRRLAQERGATIS